MSENIIAASWRIGENSEDKFASCSHSPLKRTVFIFLVFALSKGQLELLLFQLRNSFKTIQCTFQIFYNFFS